MLWEPTRIAGFGRDGEWHVRRGVTTQRLGSGIRRQRVSCNSFESFLQCHHYKKNASKDRRLRVISQGKLQLNRLKICSSWHDNCSSCFNDLCFPDEDYQAYLRYGVVSDQINRMYGIKRHPSLNSWVSVDTYEMVLISLILVVFLTGIVGNSLVVIAVTTTKSMQGWQTDAVCNGIASIISAMNFKLLVSAKCGSILCIRTFLASWVEVSLRDEVWRHSG